jgi:hypothetical protein
MTTSPYARIVLDASGLAASGLPPEIQTKTLRTAVHTGVRWIYCPTEASQILAGRSLFDLPQWRVCAPLPADARLDAIYGLSLRLRRNRIDVAVIPTLTARAARTVRDAIADGVLGGVAAEASDTVQVMAALRTPGATCVLFGAGFDASAWRDFSALAAVMSKRLIDGFGPPAMAQTPGVTGVIHAPDSPRALFRLLREYRPRKPVPAPGLAESASCAA